MKTSKRLLSLFLAVVMALTACSVGFVAFAQEINPKDNPAFNDKNASKEGSVDALNGLVNEFLPDILKLVGEQKLAELGVSIQKVTDASFNKADIKSDRFYEFMLEISPKLLTLIGGGADKYQILQTAEISMGANFIDDMYYAYLDNPDAKFSFWTLYSICKSNADEKGNEFQKLCFDYLNGYEDSKGKQVKGLDELLLACGNAMGEFDYETVLGRFDEIIATIGLDINQTYTVSDIQNLIDVHKNEIDTTGLEDGYKMIEYFVNVAGMDVKVNDLATALLHYSVWNDALMAGVLNRFANDGGVDFSSLGITGKLDYSNWYAQLKKIKGNENASRSDLAAYYLGLFFNDEGAIREEYNEAIQNAACSFFGATAEELANVDGPYTATLFGAIASVLQGKLTDYAYNEANYPIDQKNSEAILMAVNESVNNTIGGINIPDFVNGIVSHIIRTTDKDGNKLSINQILGSLQDIIINLAKDPVSTISNLAPMLTILIDEIVLPLIFNEKTDGFGSVKNPIANINTVIALVKGFLPADAQAMIDSLGISSNLSLDLNRIVPEVLSYIQNKKDFKPSKGFYKKLTTTDGRTVPVIFDIQALDKLIAENLYNLKFVDNLKVDESYKSVLKETITYFVSTFDKAVNAYLNGNDDLGVTPHRYDATIAQAMLGIEKVTMGRGLNNISIALPTIIDICGKILIKDQGINSTWEYANRIKYGEKIYITIPAGKHVPVENTTVWALKAHALDEKPDASNVTSWIIDFVLSTFGNSIIDLLGDIFTADPEKANEITKAIPIINELINSFGGFTDLSVLTDVLNGAFGLTRESKYSFTFDDRTIPYATNDVTYTGLSENCVYYLIANAAPLIRAIMDMVEANKAPAPADKPNAPYAPNDGTAAPAAPFEVKIPNFDSVLTDANKAASKELIAKLDEVLSTLLANTDIDGFTADNATGVLSAAVTFLTNHIGKDSTDKLLNLVQQYLDVINYANTEASGKNANSNGKVNEKKVFSQENLSKIVTETYVLVEDIVNTMLPTVVKGDQYGIVTGAVNGIIAPGAVVPRSDSLNEKLLGYVSWNEVKGSKYASDLGYKFSAGDSQAFLNGLYDSLGVIPSVLGVLFCTTGYYDNVFAPIFNTINAACGINPLAPATNGEEVLLALTNGAAALINKLLQAPATTLLSLVKGISGVLQDKTLKPIIIKVIEPLGKEIIGLAKFISKICPSLMNISFGQIQIPGLGALPLSLATIVLAVDMLPGLIKSSQFSNIAVTVINKLAGNYVKLPNDMPWDKFANATPEDLLLMIYAIAFENGLKDVINSAVEPVLGTTFDAASILTAVQAVLSLTSPTEAHWVFDHYIGKAANNFKFPEGITQSDADKAIAQLDNIAANVFPLLKQFGVVNQNSLPELLSGMLYTNSTLTSIAKAIYGALESAVPMFTPAVVASYLTDSSYGATYSAAAKSLNNAAKWADVTSINWGFSDGSAKAQQGFVNGLAAIFRPFNDILSLLLAEGNFGITSLIEEFAAKDFAQEGTTAEGLKYTIAIKGGILTVTLLNTAAKDAKENVITVDLNKAIAALGEISICGGNGYESAIVPLLEAFMCEGVKTYDQYIKDYNKNKDALLLDILNPLFGFVNKLASAPFDTLTAVLPNVAYFIDNNGVAQMIDNLLSPITKTALPALKEAGIDVDQLITKALETDLGSFVASKLGVNVKLNITLSNLTACNIQDVVLPLINKILADNNLGIVLPAFDWATLASHGKQTTVPSAAKNSDGDYATIRIVANQGETLVAVLRYIAQTLISNSTAIKNLITSMDGVKSNKTIVDVLNCVFNQLKSAQKDDIVRAIFYFLLQEPQNKFFDYRNFQFKEYDFTYPDTIDMQFLNVLAPMVDGILTGVLGQFVPGGLPGLVTGNIYKDDIINAVLGIYGEIEKVNIDKNTKLIDLLAMTDLDFTTAHFAQLLTDKSYGKTYDSVAKAVANAGSWSKVGKLAWGVTDRDSFLHALSAALRPMYGVLDVLLNDGALGLFDLVFIPGTDGYTSTIVPLMEAFGLYNIKTQYQYREDMSKEYDAILLDILNPLLDKVEDILNAPIQMLTDILPNLALFFANDGLLQLIENLMTPITALLKTLEPIVNVNDVLKAVGLDINKELAKLGITGVNFNIYDLTATLKPVIGAENIVGVINGLLKSNGLAIELMPIDWYQLASHGTLVSDEASQAATFGSRMYVQSERNETLVAVLRYLINTVNYKDNFTIIADLVTGMLGSADASIADVVNQVLGMLQGETDVVLSDLCSLLQTFA